MSTMLFFTVTWEPIVEDHSSDTLKGLGFGKGGKHVASTRDELMSKSSSDHSDSAQPRSSLQLDTEGKVAQVILMGVKEIL